MPGDSPTQAALQSLWRWCLIGSGVVMFALTPKLAEMFACVPKFSPLSSVPA